MKTRIFACSRDAYTEIESRGWHRRRPDTEIMTMNAPPIDLGVHHAPEGISDRVALGFTKVLRWTADTFFAKRYGHRAVVLETVAAVPGVWSAPS